MTSLRGWFTAAALLVATTAVQADTYSAWVKDDTHKTQTCEYGYTTKDGKQSKQTVVQYYGDKDRAGWAYFYNAKNEPWARCALPGNPKYQPNVMTWEALTPAATGYETFKDAYGKPEPAGYCPAPKDGRGAIPTLPLPPK